MVCGQIHNRANHYKNGKTGLHFSIFRTAIVEVSCVRDDHDDTASEDNGITFHQPHKKR